MVEDESFEPHPTPLFWKIKYESEKLVIEANRRGIVSASILRLFSVYGETKRADKLFPGLLAANRWKDAFKLNKGSYDHVHDFVHVEKSFEMTKTSCYR